MDASKVKQVEEALKKFWAEQSLTADDATSSVDDLVAAMDSMTAVDVLIDVEKIVGISLPSDKVIRRGGYDSETQFIEDLTARVSKYVEEHNT